MIIEREQDVTAAALAVMERPPTRGCARSWCRWSSTCTALSATSALTEAEFREAAAILAELGQRSTDTHNEVVLMAGSLGVSSLVCLLNNGDQGNTETAQSLLGPFWRLNSPRVDNGGIASSAPRRRARRCSSPGASSTRPALRSPARKSMSGTPRRSVFTRTRIPNRRT